MPVNVGFTLFDGNDWQSFLGFTIVSNLVGVDVNDGFGRLPRISPTRSWTPSTAFDNGFTLKQGYQPHFASFVSAFHSTRN